MKTHDDQQRGKQRDLCEIFLRVFKGSMLDQTNKRVFWDDEMLRILLIRIKGKIMDKFILLAEKNLLV